MAYNLLIVDDSDISRNLIAKIAALSGLPLGEVHQARHGEEALAILARHWIDLVFADINMPVMNGMEMIERMQQDGILQHVPVVIVSTEGSTTRMAELLAKGVRAYVRKPFTPEELRKVVCEVLGVGPTAANAAHTIPFEREGTNR